MDAFEVQYEGSGLALSKQEALDLEDATCFLAFMAGDHGKLDQTAKKMCEELYGKLSRIMEKFWEAGFTRQIDGEELPPIAECDCSGCRLDDGFPYID